VLNKRSATWRKVPDVDRHLDTATQAIALMREYPTLVKRPVLSSGATLLVGFDPESYAAAFPDKAK
jgi:arsenate reductase-like glutaredoxin family protein